MSPVWEDSDETVSGTSFLHLSERGAFVVSRHVFLQFRAFSLQLVELVEFVSQLNVFLLQGALFSC